MNVVKAKLRKDKIANFDRLPDRNCFKPKTDNTRHDVDRIEYNATATFQYQPYLTTAKPTTTTTMSLLDRLLIILKSELDSRSLETTTTQITTTTSTTEVPVWKLLLEKLRTQTPTKDSRTIHPKEIPATAAVTTNAAPVYQVSPTQETFTIRPITSDLQTNLPETTTLMRASTGIFNISNVSDENLPNDMKDLEAWWKSLFPTTETPETTSQRPVTTTMRPTPTNLKSVTTTQIPTTHSRSTDAPITTTTTQIPTTTHSRTTDATITTTMKPTPTTLKSTTTTQIPTTTHKFSTDATITTTTTQIPTTTHSRMTVAVTTTTTQIPTTTTLEVPSTKPTSKASIPQPSQPSGLTLSSDQISLWWRIVNNQLPVRTTTPPPPTTLVPTTPQTGGVHGCTKITDFADICLTQSGRFRNPSNCKSFYVCDWSTLHACLCPQGTLFDERIGVCNWDTLVLC
ncbi:mucin-2-like [Mya arenaria]|uniref:mucin-2-like n=1 Tax=Mya arenaria TaxID=6604 RepID=UPI0022DF2F12|nr:mucin-2-like [Mya arenaria]